MSDLNPLLPRVFPHAWAAAWGEDGFGLWQALVVKGIRQAFRWIPPGAFMMGSPENEKGRYPDEELHRVTLMQGFWLGETTVTQAFWQALMPDNPSYFKGENRPVECVSWREVQEFIQAVNGLHPDLSVRLPWEAEWEYACRAGKPDSLPFNFDGELTPAKVNYRGTWDDYSKWGEGAKQATADVKSYPCNAWGLYEMHGNVWEWCQDRWRENLGAAAAVDPWRDEADDDGSARVLRGGSWDDLGRNVRSAIRLRFEPAVRYDNFGFRLALGHPGSG